MTDRTRDNPDAWALRPDGRDDGRAAGTNGASGGTSGVASTLVALGVLAALLALSCGVNVATILDDAHRRGQPAPLWRPLTEEATSGLATLIASVVIWAAVRAASRLGGRLWLAAALLAGASILFSGFHVALMVVFRFAAFGAQGHRYGFSPEEWPYEYRKDLITFIIFAGTLWGVERLRSSAPPTPAATDREPPATFDIRDGQTLVRAPVADILATHAAGNYVEFLLADGRRPLMRGSMASVAAELAPAGLVRTHRSWLVNAACVRGLTPVGSGDFRIDLGAGLTAPLSRRYPAALARLRDGAS